MKAREVREALDKATVDPRVKQVLVSQAEQLTVVKHQLLQFAQILSGVQDQMQTVLGMATQLKNASEVVKRQNSMVRSEQIGAVGDES